MQSTTRSAVEAEPLADRAQDAARWPGGRRRGRCRRARGRRRGGLDASTSAMRVDRVPEGLVALHPHARRRRAAIWIRSAPARRRQPQHDRADRGPRRAPRTTTAPAPSPNSTRGAAVVGVGDRGSSGRRRSRARRRRGRTRSGRRPATSAADEAGAGGVDVERAGAGGAERVRRPAARRRACSSSWRRASRRGRGRRPAAATPASAQRARAGRRGEVGEPLAGGGAAALADAGAAARSSRRRCRAGRRSPRWRRRRSAAPCATAAIPAATAARPRALLAGAAIDRRHVRRRSRLARHGRSPARRRSTTSTPGSGPAHEAGEDVPGAGLDEALGAARSQRASIVAPADRSRQGGGELGARVGERRGRHARRRPAIRGRSESTRGQRGAQLRRGGRHHRRVEGAGDRQADRAQAALARSSAAASSSASSGPRGRPGRARCRWRR